MCRHLTVVNNEFNQAHLQAVIAMGLRCSADEERNVHGTGIAYEHAILKKGIAASVFLEKKEAVEFLQGWSSSVLMGHVRKASVNIQKGLAKNYPDNHAHPFAYNGIVFAHNGTVRNWKEVFKGTNAETDSQMMAKKLSLLEVWDIASLNSISKELLGSFTCIFRRPNNEELYFCTHLRPLYKVEITSEDGVASIFCTSKKAIEKAILLVYESLKYAAKVTWAWKSTKIKENIWGKVSPEGVPISLGNLKFKVIPIKPTAKTPKAATQLETGKDARIEKAKILIELSEVLAMSFKETVRYVNILFYNEPVDYAVTLAMAKLALRFYHEAVRNNVELLDEVYARCLDVNLE